MLAAYPTRRAILLAAAGAPVGLLVCLAAPQLWGIAALWVLAVAALMAADGLLAPPARRLSLSVAAPALLGVGRSAAAAVAAAFDGPSPGRLELAVEVSDNLSARPAQPSIALNAGRGAASIALDGRRRGDGRIAALWARWRGPLGLVWRQHVERPPTRILVTPDMGRIRDQAAKIFARDAAAGLKPQVDVGPGGDFQALKDFQTGMDRRAIDWKQSARHGKLLAREHLAERNHHIILAIDTGRLMSAPTPQGARVDQAIDAALLLAFVSLKLGDRVGLFAFDARPRAASGVIAGASAFPLLQRLAGGLDYSTEETNFTLGLTTLASRLDRRALIVVFTDFADPTSAELMIENLGRLMRTHLVLFVVFRDEEIEGLAGAEPKTPDDVTRAVIAQALARQREIVVGRLERLGAQIVEAPADGLGTSLVSRYLDAKRRELI